MPCTGGPNDDNSYMRREREVVHVRTPEDATSIQNLNAEVNRLTAFLCSYNGVTKKFFSNTENSPLSGKYAWVDLWQNLQKSLSPELQKWLMDHEASDAARKSNAEREIKAVLSKYGLNIDEVKV